MSKWSLALVGLGFLFIALSPIEPESQYKIIGSGAILIVIGAVLYFGNKRKGD